MQISKFSPQTGIIPAYAGSTCPPRRVDRTAADHPRIRGEHTPRRLDMHIRQGSSPHTRGARSACPTRRCRSRIIPAYAGSTGDPHQKGGRHRDHPRIRGEHEPCPLALCATVGSSPHTRGAPLVDGIRQTLPRIIPAYAGSTHLGASTCTSAKDHPRIRGEHINLANTRNPLIGSSPHTRGAQPFSVRRVDHGLDHPRIRGEHRDGRDADLEDQGSSPHTRGALPHPSGEAGSSPHTRGAPTPISCESRRRGIIPAYAGSTQRAPKHCS